MASLALAIVTYAVYVQPIGKRVVTIAKAEAAPSWKVVGTVVSDPSRIAVEIPYSLRNHAGLDEKLGELTATKAALAGADPMNYPGIDRLEASLADQIGDVASRINRQRDYFIGLLLATLAFSAAFVTFALRTLGSRGKRSHIGKPA